MSKGKWISACPPLAGMFLSGIHLKNDNPEEPFIDFKRLYSCYRLPQSLCSFAMTGGVDCRVATPPSASGGNVLIGNPFSTTDWASPSGLDTSSETVFLGRHSADTSPAFSAITLARLWREPRASCEACGNLFSP